MAKVYTGKIVIPGDKIDVYFAALAEAEREREPFKDYLTNLNEEFYGHMVEKFSKRTAAKHSDVVFLFIDFICGYTDAEDIKEITKGMVNTHFRQWYKRKVWGAPESSDSLKVSLMKFFQFLDTRKGITNTKVLEALK